MAQKMVINGCKTTICQFTYFWGILLKCFFKNNFNSLLIASLQEEFISSVNAFDFTWNNGPYCWKCYFSKWMARVITTWPLLPQNSFQFKINPIIWLVEYFDQTCIHQYQMFRPNFNSSVWCKWQNFFSIWFQSYISQILSTMAHTIDCVYSKILNHGLNHGLLFSIFKFLGEKTFQINLKIQD